VFVPSGPGTGYEVACSIAGSINEGVPVIVHSLNEKGAMAMVEVLGESRTISAVEGRFEDAFPGWAVHLYKITPGP
jgi:hypothetical protein